MKTSFATLETSLTTISSKTAFTTLETSLATVTSEAAFMTLKTSFATISSETAFTALETSLATVTSEAAFTTLKTSFATISSETAFTPLETSLATISSKTAFTTLETSFATISSKTAFTALETSLTAIPIETAFTPLEASLTAVASETAFTALETSLATIPIETAFTPLEASLTAVASEAAFAALETSLATIPIETAFTPLESSFTAVASKTAFAALKTTFAATSEIVAPVIPAVTETERIVPHHITFRDLILFVRICKTGLHLGRRLIRFSRFKIVRIKYITLIGVRSAAGLFRFGGSPGGKLGRTQVLALAGRILQKKSHIGIIHEPPASWVQITAPQGTDAHAHQLTHAQAQALEHLADLPFQALLQHDAGAARGSAADIFGLGVAFRNADSAQELHQDGIVKILIHRHPVLLLNASGGVGKGLSQLSLVGHDQQTLGIGIQTAHVIQMAQTGRQQVVNSANRTLSLTAAHIAAGLVQQHYHFLHGSHVAAVHLHEILIGYFHSGSINNFPVHLHTSFLNQSVSHPAGINAAGCQEFINADTSVFFGAMLFFTHIDVMSAISADVFYLFVLPAEHVFQGEKFRQKKKASRFIDIREASCIRKMMRHNGPAEGKSRRKHCQA